MSGEAVYQLYGGPGSPYSHKLRAVLRYRRIPHTWEVPRGGFSGGGALGGDGGSGPLQSANKSVIPVLRYPNGEYYADSTPIMNDLEARHQGRSLVPDDPAVAYLASLIEDMTDEYMPLPMFYFRWTEDREWCARRQMIGWSLPMSDAELATVAQNFLQRQTGQLGAMAAMPRSTVLANATGILQAMENLLSQSLFLFGNRPSFADMGLYGQLTQYLSDPTLGAILKTNAVRVFQWIHFMDDLSGHDGEWAQPETCFGEAVQTLLASLAPGYFMLAQAMLGKVGMDDLVSAAGGPRYKVKCLLASKQALADLAPGDRARLQPLLEATGCWAPLQFTGDEAAHVVPITPQ